MHWKKLWAIIYSVILAAFSAFVLLDAFVIPKDRVKAETPSQPDEITNESIEAKAEAVITENSYKDDKISITISELREYDTNIYVADIQLADASYLRAGLADDTFGRNVTEVTSQIAQDSNAILAINGDFYGFRNKGYVMRNGYLYRETAQQSNKSGRQEDLVIYEDGSMDVIEENAVSAQTLKDNGASQIYSFGPGLIKDGTITVNESSEVEQSMQSNPRTAIGMITPLHYIMAVSDGRTDASTGLTLYQLAGVMKDMGCVTAYNLDGGGSSTMWFNGEVVNQPTSYGSKISERAVSDIVYIGR